VRARTERLLGKALASFVGRDVEATGNVTRNSDGNWVLDAQLRVGADLERDTLVAKRCASLADAMALKVALAIDPLALVDLVQAPEPADEPRSARPPAARPSPEPARSPARLALRLSGGVGSGPLPGVAPHASVFGSILLSHFRLELGVTAAWGGLARYDALPSIGADFEALWSTLNGCVVPRSGRWAFPLCAGLEAGAVRGTGFGASQPSSSAGLWGGVGFEPGVSFQLTRALSLLGQAAADVTLLRPEFHVRNLPTLYRPHGLGLRASAGFEWAF
jgi:hypothetical protein